MKELCELICNSSTKSPNSVTLIDEQSCTVIMDFKMWWPLNYKRNVISLETSRNPRDKREAFTISKFHYFEYVSEDKGTVRASEWIGGIVPPQTFVLKKNDNIVISPRPAYPLKKVPIKKAKIEDLKKICCYIPEDHIHFYNDIISWPTTQDEHCDS